MNTKENLKISIVGIGNGGCNIISHLTNKNFNQVELIAIDINLQLFNEIKSVKQFEIKKSLDLGLNSILENDSSSENLRNIKDNLKEKDVVFIVSTLGGETGIYVPSMVC
jgi:cell division protein FtsZ